MLKFLGMFLTCYGLMHAVFYYQIRCLLQNTPIIHTFVIFFLLSMVCGPVITFWLEKFGHFPFTRTMAWAVFSWMGFFSLAFIAALTIFITKFIFGLVQDLGVIPLVSWPEKSVIGIMLGGCLFLTVYGFFESGKIRKERVVIHTPCLQTERETIKIVQISDLHLGLLSRMSNIKSLVDMVDQEEPDLIVSTGDFLESRNDYLKRYQSVLRRLEAKWGKYAIVGNHETYVGVRHAVRFLEDLGFVVLRNEGLCLSGLLNIVALDDLSVSNLAKEGSLLRSVPSDNFTIYLKHRPVVPESTLGLFGLQLSGHTHKGQIFPYQFFIELRYPYLHGLFDLGRGSWLYTSRGTGCWGPPIRLLSPPELTVIELKPRRS
ncbi:MAG TPA: metallophosphoesterase [Desulfohalobiaceae bacterium]|nr:metallophosphoesterase [Desulfohalobiaceae bacterium]